MLAGGAGLPNGAIPGGAEGIPGAGQVQQFEKTSVEYPVQKVMLGLVSGNLEGLDEVVSEKAKGLLAEVRDATLSEDRLAELQEQFAKPQLAGKPKVNGPATTVVLRGEAGDHITFSVARDKGEEVYKVREMSIRPNTKNRR